MENKSSAELDHLFLFTAPGGPEAALLTEFGLKEGARRTHAGQGTSNVCFYFRNAYLELIWASDEAEIGSKLVEPLGLRERALWRENGASPFGVCFRPAGPKGKTPPFGSWPYRPPYLPPGMSIAMGRNSRRREEPLLFFLAEAVRPDSWPRERKAALDHAPGLGEITSVRIQLSGTDPLSLEWAAASKLGPVTLTRGHPPFLELTFDGGASGKSRSFAPALPLSFVW